jgi:hypothetical protein
MRRDALVVGINQYPFLKDTPTSPAKHLTTPAADAEAIAQLLEADDNFKVTRLPKREIDGKIQVDSNGRVSLEELSKEIKKLFCEDNNRDTALLFFAGHGLQQLNSLGNKKKILLATSDTKGTGENGILLNDLWELLKESPVKEQIIWLDSCYSGRLLEFQDSDLPGQISGRRRFIIAASHSSETAYSRLDGKHGVLSGALIEGLNPGKIPQGDWITDRTLTDFVERELKKYYEQTKIPQIPQSRRPDHPIKLILGRKRGKSGSQQNISQSEKVIPPPKWLLIDDKFLDERPSLSADNARRYFDGRTPHWSEAIESKIPKMKIVDEIIDLLEENRMEMRLGVTVLLGATSEGKTTALMQTVVKQARSGWNVVWNNHINNDIPTNFYKRISQTNQPWLVVSDNNAEKIVKSIFKMVQLLHKENRCDIQFLICCRDTDWLAAKADSLKWRDYATFNIKRMGGCFNENFAKELITAWEAYGSLGKLEEYQQKDVKIQKLMEAVQLAINPKGRTFLGAMLRVRYDQQGFKKRIETLIERLGEINAPGGFLLDAFAYIAFPHADDFLELPIVVLAEVLGCNKEEVIRKVIKPLGEETAVGFSENFVFTRDPDIAKAATEIMLDSREFGREKIYTTLVKSAFRAKEADGWVEQLHKWQFLSSSLFSKGKDYHGLGIRLALTVVEIIKDEKAKLGSIVKLSQLYREAGSPEDSVQVFRERAESLEMDRPTYHEWGTAEKDNQKPTLGVWLGGFAISDQICIRLDKKTASICLSGLSTTFGELYDKYNDQVFIEACGAAAQLGLTEILEPNSRSRAKKYSLEPDAESIKNLKSSLAKSRLVSQERPARNIERLKAGIIAAWEQPEGNLPECVMPANQLTFDKLVGSLGIPISI